MVCFLQMFLRRFNNNISHINHILRYSSTAVNNPDFLKIQSQKPPNESGFIYYIRNFSRDPKYRNYSHFQKGNTPLFILNRLGHAFEVYPLLFLNGVLFVITIYASYLNFTKIEIWLDRSKSSAPWDWERARNNYWKQTTVAFDPENRLRKRCEIMEILQDKMLEEAKKKGTR